MRLLRALLAGTALALALTNPSLSESQQTPGQNRAPAQQPAAATFKVRTELVLVPAVVRDRSGQHISGLAQDDFVLSEDGKQRPVQVFEEVRTAPGDFPATPRRQGEFSNILPTAKERRITIILLDELNTPAFKQIEARYYLARFLSHAGEEREPTALVVLTRAGLSLICNFTTDSRILREAAKRLGVKRALADERNETALNTEGMAPAWDQYVNTIMQAVHGVSAETPTQQGFLAETGGVYRLKDTIRTTMQAMEQIAQAYAGLPGRKVLIWVSAGLPFSLNDPRKIMPYTSDKEQVGKNPLKELVWDDDMAQLHERAWRALNVASIAVYPIDACGVSVPGGAGLIDGGTACTDSMEVRATFDAIAEHTGGRAMRGRNDLDTLLRRAVQDSDSYYVLGFYLRPEDRKPGWRKLQVKVRREDASVHTRGSYYVAPPEADSTESLKNELAMAVISPLDYSSVPVSVTWLEMFDKDGKKHAKFRLVLPPGSFNIEGTGNHMDLEIAALALGEKDKQGGEFSRNLAANLRPESVGKIQSGGLVYQDSFVVLPGKYKVRFVVRDNLTGKLGSVTAPLEITN